MSQVNPGKHGRRPFSWLLAGTSNWDVPDNPRYTWDIWDMEQGHVQCLAFSWDILGCPGIPRCNWDIWDMGPGCVAES